MINFAKLASPATMLTSCAVGIVVTPYVYVGIGALFHFSAAFSWIMLPPLLLASGFLFWRYLKQPNEQASGFMLPVVEVVSWLAVIAFLFFISNFSLFTMLERAGLFFTLYLLASLLCLPIIAMRETSLEQRIMRAPKGIVVALLVLVIVPSVLLVITYQLSTPSFI